MYWITLQFFDSFIRLVRNKRYDKFLEFDAKLEVSKAAIHMKSMFDSAKYSSYLLKYKAKETVLLLSPHLLRLFLSPVKSY